MFASIKLYAYAGLLAAILALLAYAHHSVYSAGKKAGEAAGAKVATKAETARLNAEASRDTLAAALADVNARTAVEQSNAKAREQLAADVVAKSQADSKDADRALAQWMARYAKALRSTDCATALAQRICPALIDGLR